MFNLDMCLNKIPEKVRTVYLMGICGTGMGSLAGMLKEKGFQVTGSDTQIYPPMSTFLATLGIKVLQGYNPSNIDHNPDLVIVGNVIRRENAEIRALTEKNIPFVSFPQALKHFFINGKIPLVVTGTHGKTTTASLLAAILEHAGLDPGFMIGGIVKGFGRNYKVGEGRYFVVEGDEYDTAFFDKGPKFLHYEPHVAILTSIEFDHADIYRNLDEVKESFRRLTQIVPSSGSLVANMDDGVVRAVTRDASCPVVGYGQNKSSIWALTGYSAEGERTRLTIQKEGRFYANFISPLIGKHNALNALAVVAVLDRIGLSPEAIGNGLFSFGGVCRRQEVRGIKNGIMVIDDFAHHPTAVRETLLALKSAYPDKRLTAVFEPRTNSSRRKVFQHDYACSFDAADCIIVREPPDLQKIPVQDRFSSKVLVEDLRLQGKTAYYFPDTDSILGFLKGYSREGDVIAIMSNGGFDNIHERLLNLL